MGRVLGHLMVVGAAFGLVLGLRTTGMKAVDGRAFEWDRKRPDGATP